MGDEAGDADTEPAEAVETEPAEEVILAEEGGIPEEVEGGGGAAGDGAPCVTVGWHKNPDNGKCSNSPDHGKPPFAADTAQECCLKMLNKWECSEDLVEDVCAGAGDGAVAVKGGAAVLEAQEGEGATEDAMEEAEEDEEGAAADDETAENAEEDLGNVGDINDEDASSAALLEVTEGEEGAGEEGNPAADSSTTEGQGFELDNESTKSNWEGFEKEESPKIVRNRKTKGNRIRKVTPCPS